MHRHQVLGLIKDLFDGKNAIVIVPRREYIEPILDDFDRANGWFNDAGTDDFKVRRANGRERVECVGNSVSFRTPGSPHALRGTSPDVLIVAGLEHLPKPLRKDVEVLRGTGTEIVPLLA